MCFINFFSAGLNILWDDTRNLYTWDQNYHFTDCLNDGPEGVEEIDAITIFTGNYLFLFYLSLFIQQRFSKYKYPAVLLGYGDTVQSKMERNLCLHWVYILVGEIDF